MNLALLHEKISNAAVPLAAFYDSAADEIRLTKITSEFCNVLMQKSLHDLMGVYSNRCQINWLQDDIEHIRCRRA